MRFLFNGMTKAGDGPRWTPHVEKPVTAPGDGSHESVCGRART
jgi:hypothetical protein